MPKQSTLLMGREGSSLGELADSGVNGRKIIVDTYGEIFKQPRWRLLLRERPVES